MADTRADSSAGIVLPEGGRLAFKSVHDPNAGRWGALGMPKAKRGRDGCPGVRGRTLLADWRASDRMLLAKTDRKNGSYIFAIARIDPILRPSPEITNPALVNPRWPYGVRLLEAWAVPRLAYRELADGCLSMRAKAAQGAPFWLTDDIGKTELAEWLAGVREPVPMQIWRGD